MDSSSSSVQILVRAKPADTDQPVWAITPEERSVCSVAAKREFLFEGGRVFGSACTHEQLFEEGLGETAVESLLRGTDVALLSYGYPGSGKSFSLFGTPGHSRTRPEARGLAARLGRQLFDKIQSCECIGKRFHVTVSFYHVFEDGRVADLLDGRKRSLQVVGTTAGDYIVKGATNAVVSSPADIIQAIERGVLMRNATGSQRESTTSNKSSVPKGPPPPPTPGSVSARGHATHGVFVICVEQLSSTGSEALTARFTAVDLSGSAVERCHHSPHLLKEGSSILALHSSLHSMYSGDSEEKLAEVTAGSVFTKVLRNCFDRKSMLFFLSAIHADSIDRTLPALQLASELQEVKVTPESSEVVKESTAVWQYWKASSDARQELQGKLGMEEGSKMDVHANGTLLLNGSVVEDVTASCKDLCLAVAAAEQNLVEGGKPLATSRTSQPPAAPPLGSLLPGPKLPLASLPAMSRQGGAPPGRLPGLPGLQKPLPLGQPPFGGILPRPPAWPALSGSPFPPKLPSAPPRPMLQGDGQGGVEPEEEDRAQPLPFQRASKVVGVGEGSVKRKKRRKRQSDRSSERKVNNEEQGDAAEKPKQSPALSTGTVAPSSDPLPPKSGATSEGEVAPSGKQLDPQATLPPSAATQDSTEETLSPKSEREKVLLKEEHMSVPQQASATTLEQDITERPLPRGPLAAETPVPGVHSTSLAPSIEQKVEPEAALRLKASIHALGQSTTDPEPTAEGPTSLLSAEEQNVSRPSPCEVAGKPLRPEVEPIAASYLSPVDPSASLSAQLAQQSLVPFTRAAEEEEAHPRPQQGVGNSDQGSSSANVDEVMERGLAPLPDVPSERGPPQPLPSSSSSSSEEEEHPPSPPPPPAAQLLNQRGAEEIQTESAVSISQRSGSAVSVVSADDEGPTPCLAPPTSMPLQARDLTPVRHPPLKQKIVSMPTAHRNLPPVQSMNMTHLPPARNRLAPILHVTSRDPPPPSTVNIYSAQAELSDSLSSLGSESEDEMSQSGLAHTLKLPQHQRMSLGRPSLPPIPSEGGNGTVVAQYHGQQHASYAYAVVEPPRYDQVARGSGQEPQSSHTGRPSANPPTYNMEEAHGSGLQAASSSDAIGDYFRETQQFASSVEIHTAAMEGVKSSTMKKLVFQYGVEYRDQGGRTPLMYAVLGNQPKMCEVLLQLGANVNVTDAAGLTPLLWAAYRARAQAMKVLLRHEADVLKTDPESRTAYHWSMKTADTQCIKLLCKHVARSVQNKTDNEGLTPLHWAVMCDQDAHIHIFLSSAQVDATAQDPNGRTPLNYAILNFSPNCIKAILDHAEEVVNLRDGKGRTALHYACAEGSVDCIRTLLAYKSCNLHCTDYQGTTPLHWAAAANQPPALQLLLRRGSDRNQLDKRGMTALNHAQQRGYLECIQLLETYGLKRLPSNISIASQFQVPPSQPSSVDEYGHVPLHRPGGTSLLTTSQLFDRGTADGNDRESRPGSALDHTAGPSGLGASSQPGPPEAVGCSESVGDTGPTSLMSPQTPAAEWSNSTSERRLQRGWLSLLCGSSSADAVSGPVLCGRRNTAVAPMQQ